MSSNEDEYNDGDTSSGPLQTAKKRRIRRACDICRRKKIRCDGVQMPENRCTNCITCNTDCTYVEAAKKRGPPKGYVESLEIRVEKLEKLLRHLCPDEALFKALQEYLDGNWTIDRPTVGDIAKEAEENPETVASAIRGAIETNSNTTGSDPHDPTLILIEKLREMKFAPPHNSHFLGKSSGGMLLHTAIELKSEYTGEGGMFENLRKSRPKIQRAEFWDTKPWERKADATASPKYDFPDVDLALHCIDLYFKINNLYLPLLHRPTFDKLVKERLYDTDEGFAAVFLLVCAVGARQSDDPRVLVDGMDTHSAGWKWFEQVRIMKRSLLSMPTLYDLQLYCLCAQYLVGATAAHAAWTLAGIGLRLAQDIGAHRRKEHGHIHTPEDELFKRAFWALLAIERKACAVMGRSCSIHDEDFDLDWPADCDDEYWDNPDREKRFKQPPNKPSSLTSFILYLKLLQILAFALRTIHSINKPKILLGFVGQAWEQHVVAELDSALNKWVDSVPDHLRWDPNREDNSFFNQSVFLYSTYYLIQMTIHRPFIPTPTKPSPLPFPSLAICTNAARSCCHLVDVQRQRNPHLSNDIMMPTFNAGTVLLMSMWGGKRVGLSSDPKKEMADVDKCMAVLKAMEARWYYAGRLRDVLYSLACDGNLPLSQPSPPSMKRERDWEASANESSLSSMSQNEVPRVIVSSRRVPAETSVIGQTQQPQRQYQQPQAAPPPLEMRSPQFNIPPSQQVPPHSQIEQNPESTSTISPFIDDDPPVFSLPVYSNELGSFPMHGYVNFSAQAHHPRPQTHQPQLDPQTNHWYAMSDNVSTQGGEPTPHGGPSGASSSYWSQHQPVPAPQHQHYQQLVHPNHVSQSIRSSGFSISETSSSTHDPYGMDPAQIATGTMHDSGTGTLPYAQQRIPIYRLGSTDTPSPGVGSSSTMSSSQSSPGSSIENVYGGMRMDTLPNLSDGQSFHQHQHQHQGVPQQQKQLQPLTDPFGDGDTVDLWSNAPTELDDWGISELLMQGHGHSHPST